MEIIIEQDFFLISKIKSIGIVLVPSRGFGIHKPFIIKLDPSRPAQSVSVDYFLIEIDRKTIDSIKIVRMSNFQSALEGVALQTGI